MLIDIDVDVGELNHKMQDDMYGQDQTPTSSSAPLIIQPRKAHDISGWEEVVDFYSANNTWTSKEKQGVLVINQGRHRNKFTIDFKDHIEDVIRTENVPLRDMYVDAKSFQCPLCDANIKAIKGYGILKWRILKHLRKHEGGLDNSSRVECSLCFNFFSRATIQEHYDQQHPGEIWDDDVDTDVISFTNSVTQFKEISSELKRTIKRCNATYDVANVYIPYNSLFRGQFNNTKIYNFREEIRSKYFNAPHDLSLLFLFKTTVHNTKYSWMCPLCDANCADELPSKFRNDLSMRMFILRHFAILHNNIEGMNEAVNSEWSILSEEIGYDLTSFGSQQKQLEQTHRSVSFYLLECYDEHYPLISEMIRRCPQKEVTSSVISDYSICLVCYNPLFCGKRTTHFSTVGHNYLNAHSEMGEFREVPEIAEEAQPSASNFPFVTLRYSKVYRIYDTDDSDSLEFFKWRCVLPSCERGHTDDVLEFPSPTLLKMHALRHFEKYHVDLFIEDFFEFEWNLIRNDTKLELDIRSYCPLTQGTGRGPSLDITDPNDFVLPCQLQILPRFAQHLKVCGFCYWTGFPTHFLDHVPIHGYFDEGVPLVSNSNRAALSDWLYKKVTYTSVKIGSAPMTILGKVGKRIAHKLQKKERFTLEKENHLDVIDDEDSCSTNSCTSIGDMSEQRDTEEIPLETMTTPSEMELLRLKTMATNDSGLNFSRGKTNLTEFSISVQSHSTPTISNSQTESVIDSNICLDPEDAETPLLNNSQRDITQVENIRIKSIERKIHSKFSWTGSPPAPLTSLHISQISALSRNECPFCISNSGKRLRMAALASNEIREETMLAHLVIYHSEDKDAKFILETKKYRISLDKMERPLKFLLQPANDGGLLCSSCETASFPKISNLRLHWSRCVAVEGRIKCIRSGKPILDINRTPSSHCNKESQPQSSSVSCPLPRCVSAWRRSFVYPNGVGQVSHLISSHSTDKDAFEIAVTIGLENNLAEVFPFLDVTKSFANFIEDSRMLRLQCSKCHMAFGSPYELAQHAKRYHPTDEHYSGMLKCPFGCSLIFRRKLAMSISDSVLRLLHIIRKHLPDQKAVEWLLERDFNAIMENEPYYKLDVQKSVKETLVNLNQKPLIHCLSCGMVVDAHAFVEHRRRTCDFGTNYISHSAAKLIRSSNNKLSRLKQMKDVKTSNTHKSRKRSSEKCQYCGLTITTSLKYSENVTIFLHILNAHGKDIDVLKSLRQCEQSSFLEEFPYIDINESVTASIERGLPRLLCAICGYMAETTRKLVLHARHHTEMMDMIRKKYRCSVCDDEIKAFGNTGELFHRLVHTLCCHQNLQYVLEEAVTAFESSFEAPLFPFIDARRSINLSFISSSTVFQCSICKFSANNVYALLHHGSTHKEISTEKSFRDKKLETPVPCTLCNRMLKRSKMYGERFTLLAHFIRYHLDAEESCKTLFFKQCSSLELEFPFIDPNRSMATGMFECALCEATLYNMSAAIRHAQTVHRDHIPIQPIAKRVRLSTSSISGTYRNSITNTEPEITRDADQTKANNYYEKSTLLLSDFSVKDQYSTKCETNSGENSRIEKEIACGNESPSTSSNKAVSSQSQKSTSSEVKKVADWLPKIISSVIPSRQAMIFQDNSSSAVVPSNLNIKDALIAMNDIGYHRNSSPKTSLVSLFDELPQSMVGRLIEKTKSPVNISHIPGVKGFLCNFCSFKARTISDARRHTQLEHSDVMQSLNARIIAPCHHCTQVFESRSKLFAHISSSHSMTPRAFRCFYCTKSFPTSVRVREHERRVHESRLFLATDELRCPYCEQEFTSKRSRDIHVKRHSDSNSIIGRGF